LGDIPASEFSEHKGGVSKKNNRDEIVGVIFLDYTTYEDGSGRMFRNIGI
jgi:hypothetical protein